MFKDAYTGINDVNNKPINNGAKVLIIDRNKVGIVRYSIRRAGFRVYYEEMKKPQEAKTISVAHCGQVVNPNLKVL